MSAARYQGDFRDCSKCGASKCWPDSFAKPTGAVCKTCRAEQFATSYKTRMAESNQREAARRQQLRAAKAAYLARLRANKATPAPSLFDVTRTALEPLWGAYATWTVGQHGRHSAWMRALAGIPEDTTVRRRAA